MNMKVAIIRNAKSYDFGGAEKLAVHLATEVGRSGNEVCVYSSHKKIMDYAISENVCFKKGIWLSYQNWSGWRVVLIPLYLIWLFILYVWYLMIIIKNSYSTLHLMSKDDFISGTLAAKTLNKKVIWTDCADLKHIYKNHDKWYKNPVGKIVFMVSRKADLVSIVSYSEQGLIEDSLSIKVPDNYKVIHTAGRKQVPNKLNRKGKDKTATIYCCTSRLVTDKGIRELIMAFNDVHKKDKNTRLWVVGDGPEADDFKNIAGNNVKFFGQVNNPLDYVLTADIFVHPTYHEGFSLSLTEAAMLGKPMIATNVGGNPELVNDKNGILIPARDVESLYKAMIYLHNNKQVAKDMGNNAKKDYDTKFEFSKIIKSKFIPIYE